MGMFLVIFKATQTKWSRYLNKFLIETQIQEGINVADDQLGSKITLNKYDDNSVFIPH
jgi:hypothetical protein